MEIRHGRMLEELAELMMAVSRNVGEAIVDAAPYDKAEIAAELAPVLNGLACGVRQTVALEAKLEERRLAREQKSSAEQATRDAQAAGHAEYARRTGEQSRRKAVERVVETVIAEDDEAEQTDVGNMYSDLYERLDEYEAHFRFSDIPIGELAARICRAMGLNPDWRRFADDAWAIIEAEENPPGSPFASPSKPAPNAPANDWTAEQPEPPGKARAQGPPSES